MKAYLDGVPVLAGEGVDGLLLETLLALGQSLVPIESRVSRIARRMCEILCLNVWCAHFPTAMFAGS